MVEGEKREEPLYLAGEEAWEGDAVPADLERAEEADLQG
jgi:hypothetical protein